MDRKLVKVKCLLLSALVCLFTLAGCSKTNPVSYDYCSVMVENGTNYTAFGGYAKVKRGEDITFRIQLADHCKIRSADYEDYTITPDEVETVDGVNYELLTLHHVSYPTVVSLETYYPCEITYFANGGNLLDSSDGDSVTVSGCLSHLRPNTAQGGTLFERRGYVLIGWNTAPDGTGVSVGLGSRVDQAEQLSLYAQWSPWTAPENFFWEITDDGVRITDYFGTESTITVPAELDGKSVTTIAAGAFQNAVCTTVILPDCLNTVESGAFSGSTLEELYFYDTLVSVGDSSFSDCNQLKTIHINAAVPPVYSGTYFDTFPDKMDWLMSLRDQQKIVLFSGSSARFGYDSSQIDEAFPSYAVANMGVYAYSNALPQYKLIEAYMNSGDILISAPEFDTIETQFCTSNRLDREFFAMIEANYDLLSLLDCRELSGVLDAYQAFQLVRAGMEKKSYEVSSKNYDEDQNLVTDFETYNQYGDYIYPRPNQTQDQAFGIRLADYEVASYPKSVTESLNCVYRSFQAKGVAVYFTYAPRSLRAITEGSTEAERMRLHQHLTEQLCVPIISEIEDSLFSGYYFYGTDNHLSSEGAQLRTERVIADLSRQMDEEEKER